MTQSNGTWQGVDFAKAMKLLPGIDKAMSFSTRNNFIAVPNNLPRTIATWVSNNVMFDINGEIINNNHTVQQRNAKVLGNFYSYQQNCNTFNENRGILNDFVAMNSPWCYQ